MKRFTIFESNTIFMKLRLLPVLLLIGSSLQAQYLEDFESFAAGDSIAASTGSEWIVWETAQAMGEDALVSDEQALSGTKSLKLESTNVLGGPQDVVLVFGGEGTWDVTFNILVPEGNSGYYNVQENPIPGIDWAFECVLDAQGLALYNLDSTPILATTYTQGEWVSFTHHIDTDTDEMQLFIDGVFAGAFPFDGISIGGINFYAAGDGATEPTYYVDDISVNPLEELQTIGCTDSEACNYDETATLSDVNACESPGDACDDGDSGTIDDTIGEDCLCAGTVDGITDIAMIATVSPNPAQDVVRVQANFNSATLRVMSLDGKVVLEERRNDLLKGTDLLLNLNNGLYLLEVTEGANRTTQRLVVQH